MPEKNASFTMKLEPKLRSQFIKAAAASHRPASQLVRDFMRSYIAHQQKRNHMMTARKQSQSIAKRAATPGTDEYAMMREIEDQLDLESGDE